MPLRDTKLMMRPPPRAFYVKYLLPIYFDVQCMERAGTPVPNALT